MIPGLRGLMYTTNVAEVLNIRLFYGLLQVLRFLSLDWLEENTTSKRKIPNRCGDS